MPQQPSTDIGAELQRIISIIEDNEASVLSCEIVWRWQADNTGCLEVRVMLEGLNSLELPE